MMERAMQEALLDELLPGWRGAPLASGEHMLRCPFHDDNKPSLRLKPSTLAWFCFPCGEGGGVWDLARRMLGEGLPQ